MPTRTNKRTGEVQQQAPDGSWITIKPGSNMVQLRGPDPMLPDKRTITHNQATASNFAPGKAESDAKIAAAEAANAQRLQDAKTQEAVANAQAAQANAKTAGVGQKLDPAVRKSAIQGYNFADLLQQRVDEMRKLYANGPGKTKGVMGSADYLPLTRNQQFDTAADGARGVIGQTLQFTGSQLNTEHESEMNLGPYLPHAGDRDQVIQDKLDRLQQLSDLGKHMATQTLGGVPDSNGNIVPAKPDQQKQNGVVPAADDPMGLNGGSKTAAQVDPILQATSHKIGAMVAQGVPDADIRQFMVKNGINPGDTSINDVLDYRAGRKAFPSAGGTFEQWKKQNPGSAYPIGSSFYTRQVPITPTRQMLNSAAQTNLGGAMVAAPVAAANAITGDRLASMTGDPMAQTGMELLRQNHPLASLGGDIAGQASLEAAAGLIPGAQGLMATRMGRRGADALYGAYSGSGDSADGDPTSGGLLGAAVNMAGGMAGRSLQRGAGRALTGVTDPQVNYLAQQGIPLTPGRIGRGSENLVGHGIAGMEERLMGLPGFDAVIGGARSRGDQAFNSAAFRQAGGTGATGGAGLGEINTLKNSAYGFLNGTDIPLDAQFAGNNAAVKAQIPGMPGFGNEVGLTLGQLDKISAGGKIAGKDWQSALSDVKGDRSSIAGKPFASNAVTSMKDIENNLLGLADRQGPAGTVDNLNAANKLNAQAQTLAAALDKGPVQRNGQMFSAQNLDDASRLNTKKFGGRMASLTGTNRPFYDLSQAGLDVMPSLTPDSGSAGRLAMIPLAAAVPGALGAGIGAMASDDKQGGAQSGGEIGSGGYVGALTLAGLLYSKTGQKILQKALIGKRPDRIMSLGDILINKTGTAGKVGSGLARAYNYNLSDLAQ